MPTNNNINYGPAPLPGNVQIPVLGNNIDRGPAAVPPGTATGVYPPVVTPVVPVQEQPVVVPAIPPQKPIIPVVELPVDTTANANVAVAANVAGTNQQRYITILANGTVITNNATTLNFTGNGVTVSNLGTTGANIVITGGSGTNYGNSNVSTLLAAFGSNSISTTGNVSAGYFLGNGSQLTGVVTSTGNIGFSGDAIYDINGIYLENADLSHAATAAVVLPANGDANAIQVNNTYGNIALQTGAGSGITASWSFDNTGNLTFPDNSGSSWPVNTQRFGMGNIGAWFDGQWTIGEFSGNGVSGEFGIRIDPSIEGPVGMTFPNNASSNTQPVQIYSTNGGGISLYTGPSSWEFNGNGNLTLPDVANVSINYANGQPYGGSGGGGNTGNVTFDNNTVIGTGDSFGGGGLNLAIGPDSIANGNVQYLQVRGGDNPTHIHLDTGDNTYYDQYFGDDGKFVRLDAGDFGNVTVGTYNPGQSYRWTFTSQGGTIFPTLTVQRGDNPSGTITGQTLLFGNSNQEAIISTPDGVPGNEYSQRLVINPGAGNNYGEGGDIYLWAGRGGDGSGSGGDIKIRGGQGGANTVGGSGGDGGYIRIEAGDAASTGGYAGYIDITGGTSNAVGGYVTITGGSGQTQGGDANINGGFTNSGPGGRVNINGGGSGSGLSQYGNVNIVAGASTWTFDNTGSLTLPGSIIGSGNLYIAPDSNNTSGRLDIFLTVGPDIHIAGVGENLILGRDDTANVTVGVDGNVYVQAFAGGPSIWNFDNTGTLTLPQGGIVHETSIPFGGLTGNTIALKPSGGTNADQQLLVYPTAGGDNNHLHLTSGNLLNTELFLGNDDFYVKLANTGNIVINTNDSVGNTAQWVFDTTGTILTPGDFIVETPSGIPATVTAITGSSGSWESNPSSDLATTGGTGTGLTVDVSQSGGYAGAIAIHTPGTGYSNGDVITVVSGSSSATFTISVVNNQWTFGVDGNLLVPNNAYISATNATGGLAGKSINIQAGAADQTDYYTTAGGNLNLVGGLGATNDGGGGGPGGAVNITSGASADVAGHAGNVTVNAGSNTWTFDYNGNLTAPGNITTGNNFGGNTITLKNTDDFAQIVFSSDGGATNNGQIKVDGGTNMVVSAASNFYVKQAGSDRLAVTNTTSELMASTNVVIQSNKAGSAYTWTFSNTGNLTLPGNITGNTAGYAIGYRDIPQVIFTGNATIATTDAGKHYYSTLSTGNVLTIANNASQGFQIGTAISIVNQGSGTITVAQGSGVTLYLAGNATASNRSIATFGMATIMKVATDTWFINGTGVS